MLLEDSYYSSIILCILNLKKYSLFSHFFTEILPRSTNFKPKTLKNVQKHYENLYIYIDKIKKKKIQYIYKNKNGDLKNIKKLKVYNTRNTYKSYENKKIEKSYEDRNSYENRKIEFYAKLYEYFTNKRKEEHKRNKTPYEIIKHILATWWEEEKVKIYKAYEDRKREEKEKIEKALQDKKREEDEKYYQRKNTLIIMRGLPGSGKSTLAQKLKGNGVVFSIYDYHNVQGKNIHNSYDYKTIKDFLYTKIKYAIYKGTEIVIIDDINIRITYMRDHVLLAEKHGYKVKIQEPETEWAWNPAECAKRNIHDFPYEYLKKMLAKYEKISGVYEIRKCTYRQARRKNNVY